MRIITGKLRGRIIPGPKSDKVRPTTDRTKESIFSRIDARRGFYEDDKVLDLFSGSGNLAFEAISRGVESVIAVEKNQKACKQITETAEKFEVFDQITVLNIPVENYIKGQGGPFDIIFADPPYEWEGLIDLPDLIIQNNWLNIDGWFILEHDKYYDFGEHPHCVFSKKYGQTVVTIFLAIPLIDEEVSESETE